MCLKQDCAEEIRNCPRERFCDLMIFFVQNFSFFRESQHSATSEKNKIWSRKKNSVNNNGKNEQLLVKTFFCKPIFK